MTIAEIADAMENAPRKGASVDSPEGVRYVLLSDTLVQKITRELRLAAAEQPHAENLAVGESSRRWPALRKLASRLTSK